jgi:hypothetical protein
MENISKNLFNSEVKLIFNSCVNENFYIEQYIYPIVSSNFFFKRLLSTTYSSYTIKPITFVDALVNTSKIMGDNFLGLSFSGFFEEDLPRHSIITISEFKEKNLSDLVLKDLSKIFPDAGCQSINCAVYSLQGNWAAVTQVVDYYGTIGMSAEFVENLRKIYPQLDKELDDQLFDFIRYFNEKNLTKKYVTIIFVKSLNI